jgi:hypothetical protein
LREVYKQKVYLRGGNIRFGGTGGTVTLYKALMPYVEYFVSTLPYLHAAALSRHSREEDVVGHVREGGELVIGESHHVHLLQPRRAVRLDSFHPQLQHPE